MYSLVLSSTLLGISISSIRLNEQAHSIQGPLRNCIPESFEMKVLIDQFYRKAIDSSCGITLGKMVLLDRAALLTIGGGMLGFIALWSQFAADSQGNCANGASNNTSSYLNMTEYVLQF
uniref:Uncharacterized protein n=1 Tax=Plectus sambesii TaxID=2011161 RepID=A0A914UN43_9BILA